MERQYLGEKVREETEVSVMGEIECLEEVRLELIFTGIFVGLDVVVHFVQFSPDIHRRFEVSGGRILNVRSIWCSMSVIVGYKPEIMGWLKPTYQTATPHKGKSTPSAGEPPPSLEEPTSSKLEQAHHPQPG